MTLPLAYLGTLQSMWSHKFKPLLHLPNYQVHQGLDFSPCVPKECPNHQATLAATLVVPLALYIAIQRGSEIEVVHTTSF